MSERVKITIDGKTVEVRADLTILKAAEAAGIYIPRLCAHHDLLPFGACRVCTVKVNGRPQASCTTPVADGMIIESDTEELNNYRRSILEMLFVEGNHFCMFCEKSGNCELQAMAYRLGILAPRHPYLFPKRDVDASHPDVMIDRNRCILCARCVRASRDLDKKHVFGFVGRGKEKRVAVDAPDGLKATRIEASDAATGICPVGSIILKRTGYRIPIGQRKYDHEPIGSEIERAAAADR